MQIKLLELLLGQSELTFDAIFYKHRSVNSHKRLLNLFYSMIIQMALFLFFSFR